MKIGDYFKIVLKTKKGSWFAFRKLYIYSEKSGNYLNRLDPIYEVLNFVKRKTPSP